VNFSKLHPQLLNYPVLRPTQNYAPHDLTSSMLEITPISRNYEVPTDSVWFHLAMSCTTWLHAYTSKRMEKARRVRERCCLSLWSDCRVVLLSGSVASKLLPKFRESLSTVTRKSRSRVRRSQAQP